MSVLQSSFLAAALVALPVVDSAQQPQEVPLSSLVGVGARVRLSSTAVGGTLRGIVAAVDEKVLTLSREGGPPVTLPLTSITALEMSTSRKRNTLKGLGIGVLSGVLLGFVLPVDSSDCGIYSDNLCSRGEALGVMAFGGAAWGAGIGALIKSDRWSPITLNPPRAAAGSQPSRGLRVAVAFRF